MSKRRRKKGAFVLISILILVCIVLYLILFHFIKAETKIIDEIKKYGYTLDDRDTQLMQGIFSSLKDELNKSEVDYEKYAEYLSELFIVDLYTIDNKLNKYDVGGAEYVHPDHVNNYILKVEDTMYRYLEESTTRKDKMPEVSKISVKEINEDSYTYGEKNYDAYVVTLNWEYQKDLGYDKQGIITLINDKDKLYVVEYIPEVIE